MKNELKHIVKVFSNIKYVLLALVVAVMFYSLNVFIANYRAIIDFYSILGFIGSIKLFISLMIGFRDIIKISSFVSVLIISLMLGMLSSLIFYKVKIIGGKDKGTGLFSSLGILLGAFAPGCAACGIGLASALGVSSVFLAVLPFDGLELSILSIVILSIAIFKTSNSSCKVMLKQKMKGGK
ncbi:MAG: hypothetical protein Q7S27_00560 [Nanoarchaeota archaeon]|nr:hypothetical protein [Nanoarchaeota archaeon]